jgi:hypothetical protein
VPSIPTCAGHPKQELGGDRPAHRDACQFYAQALSAAAQQWCACGVKCCCPGASKAYAPTISLLERSHDCVDALKVVGRNPARNRPPTRQARRACVRGCVRACMRACVRACVRACRAGPSSDEIAGAYRAAVDTSSRPSGVDTPAALACSSRAPTSSIAAACATRETLRQAFQSVITYRLRVSENGDAARTVAGVSFFLTPHGIAVLVAGTRGAAPVSLCR